MRLSQKQFDELINGNENLRKLNPYKPERATVSSRDTSMLPKLEQVASMPPPKGHGHPSITSSVNIHCHHIRMRSLDYDNYATKYFIDTIVAEKILQDDRKEMVHSITHSHEKCKTTEEERTIIELWKQ